MNIYERLNRETSNAPIIGAYNIVNIHENHDSEQILYTILSLKNINVCDVDYYDWLNALDCIDNAIRNTRTLQPDAVLSFWLDD